MRQARAEDKRTIVSLTAELQGRRSAAMEGAGAIPAELELN